MDIPGHHVYLWMVGCDYAMIIGVLILTGQLSRAVCYDSIVHGAGSWCHRALVGNELCINGNVSKQSLHHNGRIRGCECGMAIAMAR